ncbi:hypothetical protein F2Q70_00017006 [Brassica cretica]|uniref:Uncharacterized protein n=1 Tax=Brassica cretica TaxID=69181 RepID=A0A8S9HT73_BRACR|nr:hypothetical protein F2Q70_00017006 [Brassica cretica]
MESEHRPTVIKNTGSTALKMEDMDFGQTLIDGITTTSSDESTETSIDASLQISIDDTPPEAEDMHFGRTLIDGIRTTSSDESTETSTDASLQISIDDTPPEAGKFSHTNHDNEEVVLGEPKDFVDIPTLKDRYPNHDTDSFTRNYNATDGSRRGRAKFRLNKAFTGNRKMATDLNETINTFYSELMRKFDALEKESIMESEHRPTVIKNDRSTVVAKTGESRSRPILLDNPDPGSEPFLEKEWSNTEKAEKATINLDEEEEESEEDVEIDRQEGNNVDRPTMGNIDRQTGNNVDRHSTPAKPATTFNRQTSLLCGDISELAEESFIDLCSDDPLEKVLTFTEKEMFNIDNRLMNMRD